MVHRQIYDVTSDHRQRLWRQFSDMGCQKYRTEDSLRSVCMSQTSPSGTICADPAGTARRAWCRRGPARKQC